MFDNETPLKSRRQSFRSFTNQLIGHPPQAGQSIKTMSKGHTNQSAPPPPPPPNPHQPPLPPQSHTLPSASLILGQTTKVNPRIPRPSNLAHSTIPHSYAYGAAASAAPPKAPASELSDHSSSARPRPSRPSLAHRPPTPEGPPERTPQPTSTNTNTTSVMIASAFERARWAARANEALALTQQQQQQQQQSHLHHHLHQPSPPPVSPPNQTKKRRKSRKSLDPSYKYRPGDSATSDSEAGEGIADKRERREKKLAAAAAAAEANGTSMPRATKRRRRTTNAQRESDSDDDEEGGDGIALSRGRRSIKPSTASDNHNTGKQPARKRKAPNTKSSRRTNGINGEPSESESNQGTGSGPRSHRDRGHPHMSPDVEPSDQDSSSAAKRAATFFLEHPTSPSSSRLPADEDHTMATTETSRFTNGPPSDSYEYEAEEQYVRSLEATARANGSVAEPNQPSEDYGAGGRSLETEDRTGHSQNDEASHDYSRSRSPSSFQTYEQPHAPRRSTSTNQFESYSRSDSGIREIEQVVASSRQQYQAPIPASRPRKLPVPQKPSIPISPIEELDEPPFPTVPPTGFGASVGKSLLRHISALSRYKTSFYWKLALGVFFLAMIINSIRVGDLPTSIFMWRRSSPNVFVKPTAPIENFEELVGRLTNLENVLATMSTGSETTMQRLANQITETRTELLQRIGTAELSIEDQSRITEGARDTIEARLVRADTSLVELRRQIGLGGAAIGRLEQSMATLNAEMVGIEDRAIESVEARLGDKTLPTPAVSVDGQTGTAVIAPAVSSYLEQTFASRAAVERLLAERDEKLRSWLATELGSRPTSHGLAQMSPDSVEFEKRLGELVEAAVAATPVGGISRPDYALGSGGGRIIPNFTTSTLDVLPRGFVRRTLAKILGAGSLAIARPPATALDADNSLGKCWPMAGSEGTLGIALARRVVVDELVLEHVDGRIAYELDSAPRDFQLWAFDDVLNDLIQIGEGIFDVSKPASLQRFPINDGFETQMIVLKVLSNSGNPDFTCLYRVRIHGHKHLTSGVQI